MGKRRLLRCVRRPIKWGKPESGRPLPGKRDICSLLPYHSAGGGGPGGGQQAGTGAGLVRAGQAWAPSVDISQTDREWCIEADLPGVSRDDIDVQVQAGYLILTAEMRQQDETPQQGQNQGQAQ